MWQRLVTDSARFNIGRVIRNVNVPTMALQLLSASDRDRVQFKRGGTRRIDGVDTWAVEFREVEAPVLVRGERGLDVFAEGTFWIDPATGRVLCTRLKTDDAVGAVKMTIEVKYEWDDRLELLVSATMTERYERRELVARRYQPRSGYRVTEIDCEATYSNFRRFEVDVAVTMPPDPSL